MRPLTHLLLPALLLIVVGGCRSTPLSLPQPVAASPDVRVRFDCIVNVDYTHRKPMPGWLATAQAIDRTLAAWYPSLERTPPLLNPTPHDMQRKLAGLPGGDSPSKFDIVYVGSSADSVGAIEFTGAGDRIPWVKLIADTPPAPPGRIVIVDTCHAAAAATVTWPQFAPTSLFASLAGELAYELNVRSGKPIVFARHYPLAVAWLEKHMPAAWDGRISFIGLMWGQAFCETDRGPQSAADWDAFFQRCESNARRYREITSRGSSTVQHRRAE